MKTQLLRNATLLAVAAMLFSGTNNFLTKIAVTVSADPIFYTTLKNGLVAVLLIGACIAFRKFGELRALSLRQYTMLFAIGIIGGAIPFALFFTGLSTTSALNAGLIHKTLFLWVLLFAYPFLKERLTRGQMIGVFLVFLGNLFVGGFTGFKFNSGEFMILAATLFWAVENIIAKKALAGMSSLVVASSRMVLGSLALLAFLAVTDRIVPVGDLTATQWGWTLLTSGLLFGYVITWYTALKHAPATYVATILVPATLVTNVLTAVFITHAWTGLQVISTALYILGVGAVVYFGMRSLSVRPQVPEHAISAR
jgi:drug/metabolite transporter (DMT)-like permease